jgi:hypothetical protein
MENSGFKPQATNCKPLHAASVPEASSLKLAANVSAKTQLIYFEVIFRVRIISPIFKTFVNLY